MSQATATVDIRRSDERSRTNIAWLDSRHSFSFGPHYDPENQAFGLLLVSNDDVILPDTGFSTHPHRDMEIVTWVLQGELEHTDSTGHKGIIYPGLAQRMSAGSGILHSEINATSRADLRLVQMWVVPDTARITPGYEQLDINENLKAGELVTVASGMPGDSAISTIRQEHARLLAARFEAGRGASLPDAPYVHLYVARGAVDLEGAGRIGEGDAVRLTGAGGPRVTAAEDGAEVLVWEMHAALRAA